ncbi:MAG: TRAP transporter small permease subunit [Spirochaetales bacterium]|nr:TRAP transporter small permease subunit [Spirochaetales bacterium]
MSSVWRTVRRAYRILCRVEAAVAAVSLLVTVAVIFSLAIFRTLGVPIHWALDVALLVFAWGVFLGADVAFREDKLVNVDLVLTRLPDRIQAAIQLVLYLLIGAFLAAFVYYGVDLSISTQHRSFQGIPALSYTWVTASVPVSSFLMLITVSIKIYNTTASARAAAPPSSSE